MSRLSMQRMMDKIASRFPDDVQRGLALKRLKKLRKLGKLDRKMMRQHIERNNL